MTNREEAESQLEATTAALEKAVKKASEQGNEVEAGYKDDSGSKVPTPKKERTKKLSKGLGTNRGIETMFRSAYRVQMDLTGLADV